MIAILRTLGALAVAVLALVAAAPAGAAPPDARAGDGGPSNALAQCFGGAWQAFRRDDGSPFTNQGDCVSYVARGGTLGCPAPQVGPGPLISADVAGPGRLDVAGSGLTAFGAFNYVDLTLDDCSTVRFYDTEAGGVFVPPGGQLGQQCPATGVFWLETTLHLRCYLIAGRTVVGVTIYDPTGAPVGHIATALAVPAIPSFTFGAIVESGTQQITLPVESGNAEDISALQVYFVPNMAGYAPCGSGSEFSVLTTPAGPLAVTWAGDTVTLDLTPFANPFYSGGFTLCGLAMFWDENVPVGTVLSTSAIVFG